MIPLVTCLTVTRATPERLPRLRASFADYARQSWPAKRLVVAVDAAAGGDAAAVRALAAPLGAVVIEPPAGVPLGALRNAAWGAAGGDLVCQWDDDDRHHPDRIARQVAALHESGRTAVALAEVMHLFEGDATLAWTNWVATPVGAHPGTLLCGRGAGVRYPEHGPEAERGEDSAVALALRARGALATLAGEPWLYVYVAHGANACSDAHHHMLARTLGLSRGLLGKREASLRAGLEPFGLGAPPLTVAGPNGAAFTLHREER